MLGHKPGARLCFVNAPPAYPALLDPLPADVQILGETSHELDMVHGFVMSRAEASPVHRTIQEQDQARWRRGESWKKKASKIVTDVTEDTVRDVALPLGLVDIKVLRGRRGLVGLEAGDSQGKPSLIRQASRWSFAGQQLTGTHWR